MKASVRERKLLDIEADPELSRLLIPPSSAVERPEPATSRPDASRNSSDSLGGAIACEATMRNRSISGSPARNCVRGRHPSDELHLVDPRLAAPPFLQAGAALGRIRVTGKLLPISDDSVVRRPSNATLPSRNSTARLAKTLDRGRIVRDEHDRASALLELEDLAEALALELLVPTRRPRPVAGRRRRCARRSRIRGACTSRRVGSDRQVDEASSPANATISSSCFPNVGALQPVDRTVEEDVLPAGQVRMEPSAELQEGADPPADVDSSGGRLDDPGEQPQERRLPGAVTTDEPIALPGSTWKDTSRSARTSRAGPGGARRRRPSAAALRAVDLEVPRGMLGCDLARLITLPRVPRAPVAPERRAPARRRSAFGISILRKPSRALRPLRRLVVEVPADLEMVGDEPDRADQHLTNAPAVQFRRWSRMSGPSQDSPVLRLALEGERPCLERCRSATSCEVSSSWSL